MYTIVTTLENERHCVSILTENKTLKKWHGKFAELIVSEIVFKQYNLDNSFILCRNHIDIFLHKIAMLYRSAIIYHKIESSIDPLNLSCIKHSIAEVILLQIRMEDNPIRNRDLISLLSDDFPNYNFLKFYEVIETLENNRLIKMSTKNIEKIYYENDNSSVELAAALPDKKENTIYSQSVQALH